MAAAFLMKSMGFKILDVVDRLPSRWGTGKFAEIYERGQDLTNGGLLPVEFAQAARAYSLWDRSRI